MSRRKIKLASEPVEIVNLDSVNISLRAEVLRTSVSVPYSKLATTHVKDGRAVVLGVVAQTARLFVSIGLTQYTIPFSEIIDGLIAAETTPAAEEEEPEA